MRPNLFLEFVRDAIARDIAWRVRYLRTKNAHKQLARAISSPEPAFLLVSTKNALPVPLDKGKEGSGDEIALKENISR